jgi:hypothetical protein
MVLRLSMGGILKGQELIQNARITMTVRDINNYDAATLTFKDSYGVFPGDINNPSARLPNCTTGRCTTAGNGDGLTGPRNDYTGSENNAFWLHLAAANMISGIDMNSTWSGSDVSATSFGKTALGGQLGVAEIAYSPSALYPDGFSGPYWLMMGFGAAGTSTSSTYTATILARIDRKMDDGKPWNGRMTLSSRGGVQDGDQDYHNADGTAAGAHIKTAF